jgi:hypothetical protein
MVARAITQVLSHGTGVRAPVTADGDGGEDHDYIPVHAVLGYSCRSGGGFRDDDECGEPHMAGTSTIHSWVVTSRPSRLLVGVT